MISSEKLNQEVEAPISGTLLIKNAGIDGKLEVGAPIAVIGEVGEVVVTNEVQVDQPAAAPIEVETIDQTAILVKYRRKRE